MTDNPEDQIETDLDAQDDLDQDVAPAPGPSLKDAWQNNPLLKVGAAVLVAAIGIGAYTTLTKPNPVEETKSFVHTVDTKQTKAVAGKDTFDKEYLKQVEEKNKQRAQQAANTGGSALPTPTSTGKSSGLAIPKQSGGGTDPLQEWKNNVEARRIKSNETNLEEDMSTAPPTPELVPLVQPVHPQPAVKMDPAAAQALSGQMRTILTAQKPGKSKVVSVTAIKSAYAQMKWEEEAAAKAGKAGTGAGGSISGMNGKTAAAATDTAAKAKVIMPAGHIIYAQLLTELNSDIPAPALATVMSGPFTGGRMIGKFTKQDDYLVITYDRIIKDDVSYKVNGIALDEATTLPALQSDIDHHYFDRIVLPAAAKFVTGYADSISQTGTQQTTTAGGGVVSSTPKPTPKESLYKGLDGAAQTVGDIITEDAKKEATIRVTRGATMGVLFLDAVTTASVEK